VTSFRDESLLAEHTADAVGRAYESYQREFVAITRRAGFHFEKRDWHGAQRDAVERLDLYARAIGRVVAEASRLLGERRQDKAIWAGMKAAYSARMAGRLDLELAETFFNSVTRRVFATVGVDPDIEFVNSDFDRPSAAGASVYTTHPRRITTESLIKDVLLHYRFGVPYQDAGLDARLAAGVIEAQRLAAWGAQPVEAVEMIVPVFYRGKGAYLIGRIRGGDRVMPLVLALHHDDGGIVLDATLVTQDEVSIVFSFTRSYFHVELEQPHAVIQFLSSIMPLKRVAELYIALGYNKHGKTELYRDLRRHLDRSTDQFEIAPGDRGMVMVVFTLPSYDIVFKVIRDRFLPPKSATRQEVMDKYQLVFKHDRAGRLVDAQEFEHLAFARQRFSEALQAELTASAAGSVTVTDSDVDIRHLYIERRMTPLNLYLADADEAAAREAALDYGQAVKDLAATNIFPGDLLLKNFGVTRHGRVIFYDYDELCLLTDCNFRDLPQARDDDEEMSGEPWFYVGESDIFPEEFIQFLGFQGAARESFLQRHGDLLSAVYWRHMQTRHLNGEVVHIFPYRPSRRLRRDAASG
jgi:isocitrate dehydrogenase kinase/phosphatase